MKVFLGSSKTQDGNEYFNIISVSSVGLNLVFVHIVLEYKERERGREIEMKKRHIFLQSVFQSAASALLSIA